MPPEIADYALLSDCRTSALVSRDGSVDRYCPDRFDASSVFTRLLDPGGGHWSIRARNTADVSRAYIGDTMVLCTEFRTSRGRATLTEALALGPGERGHEIGKRVPHALIRRIEGIEGQVAFDMEFASRPEYGLTIPLLIATESGITVHGGPVELCLTADCPVQVENSTATARFSVGAGETVSFGLAYRRAYGDEACFEPDLDVGDLLAETRLGWQSWADLHTGYDGPYREQVKRSAIVLQALTYQPSGAVIAAPTTSLPEIPGGDANWDYRFVWLRDLGLTMRALWVAACPDETAAFFRWTARANGGFVSEQEHLQIMYGVEGERDLTEHTLDHLVGFAQSAPVRVGNDAWRQKQLDVLGEIVDIAYLLRDQLGEEFDDVTARLIASLADVSARSWTEPGAGMWEARDRQRHYLSSKVMCWVSLDRAITLAPRLGDYADEAAWRSARDDVRAAILDEGWCEELGAYTGAFGSDHLDASVLLMPLMDFLPATDERMRSTIDAIERELAGDGLVHRWAGDDKGFFICTYWLVECLARAGESERATRLFERTTAYANDVSLLAEMGDPATGMMWGNFPQAFSHVGLINAAWSLAECERAVV